MKIDRRKIHYWDRWDKNTKGKTLCGIPVGRRLVRVVNNPHYATCGNCKKIAEGKYATNCT